MPCTMICLTPVIIGAWPSILPCLAGVAAALGLTAVSTKQKVEAEAQTETKVEIEVDSKLREYAGEEMEFVSEGLRIGVRVSSDGGLIVSACGSDSKEVLSQKARTFAGRLQQAYAYDKAMSQLRQSGFTVSAESVEENGQIHVTLRRF